MRTSGWDGNNWANGGTGKVGNTSDGGTGNSWDGNEAPYVGTVDGGGNRDERRGGVVAYPR